MLYIYVSQYFSQSVLSYQNLAVHAIQENQPTTPEANLPAYTIYRSIDIVKTRPIFPYKLN